MRKKQLIGELRGIDGLCVTSRFLSSNHRIIAPYFCEVPFNYYELPFGPKKIIIGSQAIIGCLDLSRRPSYVIHHAPKPDRGTYEVIGEQLDRFQNAVLEILAKYGIATKSPQDMHLVK